MATEIIDGLFILTLMGLLVLIIMLIVVAYRTNHVLGTWTRVSDTVSDSLVRLIPAVLNVATVGKAIHQVLETIAEHKKKEAEKK